MKRKTRLILAAASAVGLLFLWAVMRTCYYTVGDITWFKFPFHESDPIVEFVYYKEELLYFGCFERAVDIDLN